MYDSRLGRWFKLDAKDKPYQSDYIFAADNPIIFIDKDGKDDYYFDRVTHQTYIIRNGKPNNYYIAEYSSTETIKDNVTMEVYGFSGWKKTTINDKQIQYITLENGLSVFEDALKHSRTPEQTKSIYESYHTISEEDKAKLITAIVGIAAAPIIIAEMATSAVAAEISEITTTYAAETYEEVKSIEGAINTIRKLNTAYEDISDGIDIGKNICNGEYEKATQTAINMAVYKTLSGKTNGLIDNTLTNETKKAVEATKLGKDVFMKLHRSATEAVENEVMDNYKYQSENNNSQEDNEKKKR